MGVSGPMGAGAYRDRLRTAIFAARLYRTLSLSHTHTHNQKILSRVILCFLHPALHRPRVVPRYR